MNGAHWTEQNFIEHVYGLGPGADHLEQCSQCREHWLQVCERRQTILQPPPVSSDLLAEQRRSIYRRLGQKTHSKAMRVVPAFAAAVLLLIGSVFVHQAPHVPSSPATSASDAQLFSEIYALEQSSEPHVATPMRELFEEN